MGRARSIVHEYYTSDSLGGVACRFCNHQYKTRNPTKMTEHLLGRCTKCPAAVKGKFGMENADESSTEKYIRKEVNIKIFEKVRRYCIALVKECGRPIEILDDAPFKNLLKLIIRDSDSKHLTSAAIREFMETTADVAEDTILEDAAPDESDEQDILDNNDGDSDYEPPKSVSTPHKRAGVIKHEKLQCVCQLQDEDGSGDHKIGCPLFTAKHYWAYFEVSVDDARCNECHSNVKWTTMSDLKSHLDIFHTHLLYKDDDEIFTETLQQTLSEAGSYNEQEVAEEVNIDNDLTPKPPYTGKKRKLPSFPTQKSVTLKDNQTITLDRFKCLDRFGLYIAALMKMIPEDKCIKYQEQIINRLLREQAAAG